MTDENTTLPTNTQPSPAPEGAGVGTADPVSTPHPAGQNQPPAPGAEDDSLGIDREFLLQMAQVPVIALVVVLINAAAHALWGALAPAGALNLAPLAVISVGMLLCAVIDGWAFRVPNWLTLSLILSGWAIGALHTAGVAIDSGTGGFGSALLGTVLGWVLLYPMLAIGGMGHGDVKMQMGFGAWVGAFYGFDAGWKIILYAFCAGALIGGVFAAVIILLRRQFRRNLENFREIGTDLGVMVREGSDRAFERAQQRRKDWVRLPYGVPLCAGFLGYLAYIYLAAG